MEMGKKLAKNSIAYFLGKALMVIVSIICLPIYTSKISTDNYGYYELVNTIVTYGIAFICLEVWTSVLRLSLLKNNENDTKAYFSSSFIYVVGICALCCFGVFVFNFFSPVKAIWLVFSMIIVTAFNNLFGGYARSLQKSSLYATSGVISSLVNVGVGCLCVFVFKMQYEALFLAIIAGRGAQILFLFITTKIYKYISFKHFSFSKLKTLLVFGFPFAVSAIFLFFERDIDKTLIDVFMTEGDVGTFSVALKFMGFISAIVDAFALAWRDTTFSIVDKNERINNSVLWINRLFMFIASISFLFIPAIYIVFPYLIKGSYSISKTLIPILYFSVYFNICNGFLSNSLLAEMKTKYLLLSRLAGSIVNLAITFSTIFSLGLYGASLGYSIGTLTEFVFSFIFCRKKLNMNLSLKSVPYFCVFYAISAVVFYLGDNSSNILLIVFLLLVTMIACQDQLIIIVDKCISFVFRLRKKDDFTELKNKRKSLYDFNRNVQNSLMNKKVVLFSSIVIVLNIALIFSSYLLSFCASNLIAATMLTILSILLVIGCFYFVKKATSVFSSFSFGRPLTYVLIFVGATAGAIFVSLFNGLFLSISNNAFPSFLPTIVFLLANSIVEVIAVQFEGKQT